MFHAISIKPGENHVTALQMVWRVSSVALDHSATLSASEADSKKATAVCFHKEGVAHTLCTLRPRVCEQHNLDLSISPEQPFEFSVRGAHTVHISGELHFVDDGLSDGEGSDDFAEASSDSSDAMDEMEFDEDDSDDDEDDSDDDQGLVNVDESYGTLALAAMVQGQEFEESGDSEDDEWGDDDNIAIGEDSDEDSDEGDSEDDEPRIQELTEEEMKAFLKSQQQSQRLKREKKPLDQANKSAATPVSKAEKSPAKALKSPATKAANHDENGEPLAKRKPVAESPKPAEVKQEPKKQPQQQQQQTQKLAGGMTAKTIKQGNGKGVKPGQRVFVRYRGRLAHNNKEFDSNMTGKPFAFRLGKGEVIKGWDEGVKGMKSGEVRELKIPPALGYGGRGVLPNIPGNSTLLFTVELLRFK